MNDPNPQSDNPLHERLVAYLDGELSHEENEAIESQIAGDEESRDALRDFDRAWNLLDELPQARTEPDFAKTTVEMVASAAEREVAERTAELPLTRRRGRRSALVMGVGGALAGCLIGWFVLRQDDRRLLRDLPVIHHVATLAEAGDAEFLERLAEEPWVASLALAPDTVERADGWEELAHATLRQREGWVRELDDEQVVRLAKQRDAFFAMAPARQQVLRETDALIADSDTTLSLRRVALVHQELVESLTPGDRAELLVKTPEERVQELRELYRKRNQSGAEELSDDDALAYRSAIREYAAQDEVSRVVDELLARLEGLQERPDAGSRRSARAMLGQLEQGLRSEPATVFVHASRSVATGRRAFGPPVFDMLDHAWREWEPRLLASLPTGLRESIEKERRHETRAWRLNPLLMQALRATDTRDPLQFFSEELSNDEIDALLMMPTDEMMDELRRRMDESSVEDGLFFFGPADRRREPPRPPGR